MRLIACDLDGTLLDHTGVVTDRTVAALRAAGDAGVVVAIATGRPPFMAAPVIERLGPVLAYGVMANGSIVTRFSDGETLRMLRFDVQLAIDAVRALRAADPRFGVALATDAGFAREPGFAERMPAASPGEPVPDALVAAEGATEAIKLMVFHPEHTTHEMLELVPAIIGPGLAVSHMGADAVEIGPAGVDKGSGLRWLCEHLGIDAADVVAFGDEYNDHEMLQWAGHGVAMGNAPEVTRALADEVAPSNADDGVAVVVERLLGAG
jgi:Cof subfamily protein (haloacid dehalogenase superfamily)